MARKEAVQPPRELTREEIEFLLEALRITSAKHAKGGEFDEETYQAYARVIEDLNDDLESAPPAKKHFWQRGPSSHERKISPKPTVLGVEPSLPSSIRYSNRHWEIYCPIITEGDVIREKQEGHTQNLKPGNVVTIKDAYNNNTVYTAIRVRPYLDSRDDTGNPSVILEVCEEGEFLTRTTESYIPSEESKGIVVFREVGSVVEHKMKFRAAKNLNIVSVVEVEVISPRQSPRR